MFHESYFKLLVHTFCFKLLNIEVFGCFEKAGLPNCSQTAEGLKVLQGCVFMGDADNFYDFR